MESDIESETGTEQEQVPEEEEGPRAPEVEEEGEKRDGLKGSPSSLLREVNERRATLDRQHKKRMSNFEEQRRSRLSEMQEKEKRKFSAPQRHPSQTKGTSMKGRSKREERATEASMDAAPAMEVRLSVPTHGELRATLAQPTQPRVARPSRMPSIMIGRRLSTGEEKKGPRYAPTYRMESKNPFKAWQVYHILSDIVGKECETKKQYDPMYAAKRCMDIAKDIRTAVRQKGYDRYKFCVKVDMGQKFDQGVVSVARFMWDIEKDDFAFHTCENTYYFVIASVFAFYYD